MPTGLAESKPSRDGLAEDPVAATNGAVKDITSTS